MLCGEEMRTGMGCRGLDRQEGAAVVCESAGIQLPDTSLDLLFLGLTGASYPGSSWSHVSKAQPLSCL